MSTIHSCVDCAALPAEEQPRKPRPAPHGGPRSRRCTTHERARKQAARTGRHAAYVLRKHRIPPELWRALWTLQGERCPCGRKPARMPDTDHDHQLARGHDHPVDEACPDCLRGLCCRACNSSILAWYNADQLRALADYLDDPPAAKLR